jgi:hypothetical protein
MTVPIRPPVWPPAPAFSPGRTDTRLTAQKAFFQAARAGQAAAGAAPLPASAAPTKAAMPTSADAPPDRLPRPGSIIDILV